MEPTSQQANKPTSQQANKPTSQQNSLIDTSIVDKLNSSTEDCFYLDKKDLQFKIKIGDNYYQDKDQVFLCQDFLPDSISILHSADNSPVVSDMWDWGLCDCQSSIGLDNQALITWNDFSNGRATVKVKFTDPDPSSNEEIKIKLKIRLLKEVKIDFRTHQLAEFAYDENNKKNYPYYYNGVPWKFLQKNKTDSIRINGHDDMHLSLDLYDKQSQISYGNYENIYGKKYFGMLDRDSIATQYCLEDSLVVNDIYSEQWDTLYVHVYTVCETDDDFANYCVDSITSDDPYTNIDDVKPWLEADCVTPISSDTFECINRGLDQTLDYSFDHVNYVNNYVSFWGDKENDQSKPLDSIKIYDNRKDLTKIYPSHFQGDYYCNNRPFRKPQEMNRDLDGDLINESYVDLCPKELTEEDIENLSQNLNIVYNKIGIEVVLINKGEIVENYDSFRGDNDEESKLKPKILYFHNFLNLDNFQVSKFVGVEPDTTTIWIINQKDISTAGRGEFNTVILNEKLIRDRTPAHEIAHAKYELYHPDDKGNIEDGFEPDTYVKDDKFNFMNSGHIYNEGTTHDINKYRIRRYQWEKIQKKHN